MACAHQSMTLIPGCIEFLWNSADIIIMHIPILCKSIALIFIKTKRIISSLCQCVVHATVENGNDGEASWKFAWWTLAFFKVAWYMEHFIRHRLKCSVYHTTRALVRWPKLRSGSWLKDRDLIISSLWSMFENRQIAVIEAKCHRFRNSPDCLKTQRASNNGPNGTQKGAKRSVMMLS